VADLEKSGQQNSILIDGEDDRLAVRDRSDQIDIDLMACP
jgi:hypothetical protein